jgi:CubicO group peptidase (beta-lactamase class C family)
MKALLPALLLASSASAPHAAGNATAGWADVRQAIDGFALITNCHVIVGDASGQLFAYQKGNTDLDTSMALFSATKWVSGVAIMTLVQSGALALDDRASDHLPYWTTDPANARSRVTLRQLLGFTSGFSGGVGCGGLLAPDLRVDC